MNFNKTSDMYSEDMIFPTPNQTVHEHSASLVSYSTTSTSTDVVVILQWIVWATLPQIIVTFGIAGNVINIICFVKQGFKDTVNVTFVGKQGLAVTDLGCLLTLIWSNICFTPAFHDLDLPFETIELQFMTSGIPHVLFVRISSWITALITVERCMCITMPLKVKDIITPKRVCIINIAIFIVLTLGVCPMYGIYNLGNKFYPERNKTLLGIVYIGDRERFDTIFYPVNFFAVPITAFIVIIVCTSILVIELNNKAKWRQESSASSKAATLTSSNIRVAKMVIMISAMFIICFISNSILPVAMAIVPELSIDGKYSYILTLLGGVGFFLESINSSANIFIYYHMSSKFRDVFLQLFKVDALCTKY